MMIQQLESDITADVDLQSVKDYAQLFQLSILLHTENDLDCLLEKIARKGCQLVEAERFTIYLVDAENQEIYSKIALGLAPDQEIRLPIGRGIAGNVAFSKQLLNIGDAQQDNRHAGNQFGYFTHSLLTVPMCDQQGQIIGVVQAINKKGGNERFSVRDEQVLQALCSLAAIAIEQIKNTQEQQRLSEALLYQAQHDVLTKLPNRILLEDFLAKAIREAGDKKQLVAVIFLDLNHFRLINDSLGHYFGDRLLEQVAHRLQHLARFGDMVARQGGDEFVLVLKSIKNEQNVHRTVQTILQSLQQPYYVDGQELYISASAGISLYPQHAQTVTELLRLADTAMYKIKSQNKNGYQLYEANMTAIEQRQFWLITQLHKALEYKELVLHYQPQQELKTGKFVGVEALIRWKHSQLGFISPAEFIPLAEETGLILPLGTWVLEESCRQAKHWQMQGFPPLRMSVNVSALQFGRDNFIEIVMSALKKTRFDPRWLEIELTEGVLIGDTQTIISKLNQLKKLGITIAIDDFGTGYSSLRYLQQLPIDTLKIDQSFVRAYNGNDDENSSRAAALIKTIATLAHNLNMHIIAEGVETETQKQYLQQLGCEDIQGYLYSKPLSVVQLEQFLQHQREAVE